MSIFISYSHDDKQIAHETIALLELAFPDTKLFWDKQLLGGDNTDAKLRDEVRWCQAFVFIASHNSMHERCYCQWEVTWALDFNKPIIPYIICAEPEEVIRSLGDTNFFYIDARAKDTESFAKLCGSISRAVTPHTESHRRQMKLLYSILHKLEDYNYYVEAAEVYENGYELEYPNTPALEPPLSEKRCQEILEVLSMMDRLQTDWARLSDEAKAAVEMDTRIPADFLISNVGFQKFEENREWGYLRFLRRHGRFEDLNLVFEGDGGHSALMLPAYRKMLAVFNSIRQAQSGTELVRRILTPDELIAIINAQFQ